MNLDWEWLNRNLAMIGGLLVEHVILALVPVVLAFVISLPLGYLVFKTGKPANVLLAILGVIYSIPSLALFVLMPLVLGTQILNPVNIAAALTVYSIALLIRSVVDGLRSVSPSVKQSASAMGYGSFRRLFGVELPLAMPVIFAGLRVVTVSNIALVSGRHAGRQRSTRQALRSWLRELLLHAHHRGAGADACSGADRRRADLVAAARKPSVVTEAGDRMNLFDYISDPANWRGEAGIGYLLLQQLGYTAAAVAIAALIAIPLGILIGHTGRGSFLVIGLSNAARAIPSLGLLVLVVLLLGTGNGPIVGVLAVLALPAILTATAAGIQGADHGAVHAAHALGMSGGQVIGKVEWPLALPLVISGLRSAALQVVATATIAAYSSGTGLGRLLISGNANRNYSEMFAGALMVALLAIVLDVALGTIAWLIARRRHSASKTVGGALAVAS